jgi:hypothetical protein
MQFANKLSLTTQLNTQSPCLEVGCHSEGLTSIQQTTHQPPTVANHIMTHTLVPMTHRATRHRTVKDATLKRQSTTLPDAPVQDCTKDLACKTAAKQSTATGKGRAYVCLVQATYVLAHGKQTA